MARGVNKVILIGNLGDEPQFRTTNSGTAVVNISMVTNEMRKNIETGQPTELAEWHRVVMWGKLAEIAHQWLHKGSQIYVEGKLRTRSYTDKQNIKRSITEIVADEMQMLGGRAQNAGAAPDEYNIQEPRNSYSAAQGSQSYGNNSYGAPQANSYSNANAYGNQAPTQAVAGFPTQNVQSAPQNNAYGMQQAPAQNYGQVNQAPAYPGNNTMAPNNTSAQTLPKEPQINVQNTSTMDGSVDDDLPF